MNGIQAKQSLETLKMTNTMHNYFHSIEPTVKSPSLHLMATPRAKGQPEFYYTKENFTKIKNSFGKIPEFALKPLSPRALYSERNSNERMKPVMLTDEFNE